MVLTRAQRAQSSAGIAEVPKVARTAKPKAKSTATTTKTRKAVQNKAAQEDEEIDEVDALATRKSSLATSSTASTAAKSKATKKDTTENGTTKATGARKQVKFAEDSVKPKSTKAISEAPTTRASRGRPRKAPVAVAEGPTTAKATATKRGRPAKAISLDAKPEASNESTKSTPDGNEHKSSVLGKPIRAKKAPAKVPFSANGQESVARASRDAPSTTSLLSGPEPKLGPPIRASPMKMQNSPIRSNLLQPIPLPSLEASSQSLGSPIRVGTNNSASCRGSPVRADPIRLPQSSSSLTSQVIAPPVSIATNPLLQSPVRASAKKTMNGKIEVPRLMATPSRCLGTPIRRAFNAKQNAIPFPQTAQPRKRSYVESPQRPTSAQAFKKTKLFGTPLRSFVLNDVSRQSRADIAAQDSSVKKSVSFDSPALNQSERNAMNMTSPTHRYSRMSAVTEVTEPEESFAAIFSIKPSEDVLKDAEMLEETINNDAQLAAADDTFMTDVVGADYFRSSPIKQSAAITLDPTGGVDVSITEDGVQHIIGEDFFNSSPRKQKSMTIVDIEQYQSEVSLETTSVVTHNIQIESDRLDKADEPLQNSGNSELEMQVQQSTSLLAADVLELAIATALPEPLTILTGMTFFVDIWAADGSNADHFFVPLLEELGAEVLDAWTARITHVLFKDGKSETLRKIVQADGNVRCLNVGWAVDCERSMQRIPEEGYEIDPIMEGNLTPVARTPLRELRTPNKTATPVAQTRTTPAKTPLKTPGKITCRTPGKTPGTVKFNATIMAFHNAIQTPELAREAAFDAENMESPLAHVTPLLQKTCPPKQTGRPLFAEDATKSAVKRRLFKGRRSLGDALTR